MDDLSTCLQELLDFSPKICTKILLTQKANSVAILHSNLTHYTVYRFYARQLFLTIFFRGFARSRVLYCLKHLWFRCRLRRRNVLRR